jgi:hypothetical protein
MFDLNTMISKGQLLVHTRKFLLYPPYWKETNNHISTPLNWKSIPFDVLNHHSVPKESGLYCFVLIPSYQNFLESKYVMYIGKTNRTLHERFKEYLSEQAGKGKPRYKIEEMLNLYQGHLFFYYCPISDKKHVDSFEEKLINAFVPFINTSIPNAKLKPELKNIYAHG